MRQHRLHLNVTENCNIRCIHCYWDEYGKHPDAPIEAIDEVLGKFKILAKSYGERRKHILTLGGGEPTIRKDLEDIITLAVRSRFKVRLVTNAITIDEKRAVSLKGSGLQIAQVSLDGACEATHDRVRGNGSWARTMKGIAALKKACILVVLSYVLLPGINMEEAPRLLDLVKELRVAGAKYARPIRDGQMAAHDIKTQGDFWETFQNIVGYANQIHYRRLLFFFDPLAHLLPLQHHTNRLWGLATDLCQCNNTELVEVDACSGDIYYCRIRIILGNIFHDDLAELWRSHPLLDAIRRKSPEGACKGCSVWERCRGGCPAVVSAKTEIPLLQDEDCRKVQQQGSEPKQFPANGFASPYRPTLITSIRMLGRKMKDAAFRIAFE